MTISPRSRVWTFALTAAASSLAHAHGGAHPPAVGLQGRVTTEACRQAPMEQQAACARQGIESGAPVVILDESTGKATIAVNGAAKPARAELLPHAGQRVIIEGPVARRNGRSIVTVRAVTAEHDHTSLHGGMVVMWKETHLEGVALASGQIRVYLSDAFRRPLSVTTWLGGTVEVGREHQADHRRAALETVPSGEYLVARLPATTAESREVTVHLPMPDAPDFAVTLMLTPTREEGAPSQALAPVSVSSDVAVKVGGTYEPSEIVVHKGVPTRLHFLRQTTSSCSSELKIPAFGVDRQLAAMQETVVEITPDKAGTFDFTCGMGMLHGKIVVRE
jgi:hypothetical protein